MSDEAIPKKVASEVARGLARDFGGNPSSSSWRQFGRLAGFTNLKPEHLEEKRSPYVLARACGGETASRGWQKLKKARESIDDRKRAEEYEKRLHALKNPPKKRYERDAVREYKQQASRLLERYGSSADLSKLDWMVVKGMAMRGYSVDDLREALKKASPRLFERQKEQRQEQNYINRTVKNVMQDPEIKQARRELSRGRGGR